MKGNYVIVRHGKVARIKDGLDRDEVLARHPDWRPCVKPPSQSAIERMIENCSATATDGCRGVDPDGTCQHGCEAWPLFYSLI